MELLNCTSDEYISATSTIAASNEWWERKIKENKDFKEYMDKDCREVYNYKVLFGDAFDNDKYAVTPSQMCWTGFAMFEDSGYEDLLDTHPDTEENSGSSDEGDKTCRDATSIDVSRPRSGDKCRSGSKITKEKRSKIRARDLSYSVNRATSASQQVAKKIDKLVGPAVTAAKTLMSELMATGRLQKKTELYF